MGSEAENIFKLFTFGTDEKDDDYDTVLAKYDAYFVPNKNVTESAWSESRPKQGQCHQ